MEKYIAMGKAREAGLDLVEVSPESDPPVCRIMDYGKWLYEQKRKYRESRKKTQHYTGVLKEIRLRPETDKHDLEIKTNHAREFLQKGNKVQFTMMFRGRQVLHNNKGYEIFNRIIESIQDVGKVEQPSTMSNKRMILLMVPK